MIIFIEDVSCLGVYKNDSPQRSDCNEILSDIYVKEQDSIIFTIQGSIIIRVSQNILQRWNEILRR